MTLRVIRRSAEGPPGPAAAANPELPVALAGNALVTGTGQRLPLRAWGPTDQAPRAVVLGLHGFNDYAAAFDTLGPALAARGIILYAYDQRGFGGAPERGAWPGHARLVADFAAVVPLLRARHPELPFHVLGESMGAAVALLGLADPASPLRPLVSGVILVSTAVWGGKALSPLLRGVLLGIGDLLPRLSMTKPYSEARMPSDNRAMIDALWADPQVITETRLSAVAGLVRLVDAALKVTPSFDLPGLVLFGDQDRVNPPASVAQFLELLPRGRQRVAFYANGWHMLLRDHQAAAVIEDLAGWLLDPAAPLVHGRERA